MCSSKSHQRRIDLQLNQPRFIARLKEIQNVLVQCPSAGKGDGTAAVNGSIGEGHRVSVSFRRMGRLLFVSGV